MSDLARLILLLALLAGALTLLGGAAIWLMEDERRLRRALKKVLGCPPEAMVAARGRAAGFAFSRGEMAVAWDSGAWCLVYRVDELMGAELVIDGEVQGRAYRGEPRRALERTAAQAEQVTLRLLFDDPGHPDFDLDLWVAGPDAQKGPYASPAGAVQEANRWLARAEAILRRQGAGSRPAAVAKAPPPPPSPPSPVYELQDRSAEPPPRPEPRPHQQPGRETQPQRAAAEPDDAFDEDDPPF